ncbi:MAG: hypothetical protein WDO68_10680 [Gammaproteobacteria bacterium]
MTVPIEELAELIQKRREELFQASAVVELCKFACMSQYAGGMHFERALAAFELLYTLIDKTAGELGELRDRLREAP